MQCIAVVSKFLLQAPNCLWKRNSSEKNIFQILLSQYGFPLSITNRSFFPSSFLMIRKRNTPKRQQKAPQTCWWALVAQVSTAGSPWSGGEAGHPLRAPCFCFISSEARWKPALSLRRVVCVASTLCRSYRGFGQDRLRIFSSTSEEYFLFVRELLAFLYIIDVCFMPRLCFFHVILGSPGTLDCL